MFDLNKLNLASNLSILSKLNTNILFNWFLYTGQKGNFYRKKILWPCSIDYVSNFRQQFYYYQLNILHNENTGVMLIIIEPLWQNHSLVILIDEQDTNIIL